MWNWRARSEGIDMIVGGHTQNPACMKAENVLDRAYVPGSDCTPDRQNGTWVVQAHEWGKYVGRADFTYKQRRVQAGEIRADPHQPQKTGQRRRTARPALVTYTPEIAETAEMLQHAQAFPGIRSAKADDGSR